MALKDSGRVKEYPIEEYVCDECGVVIGEEFTDTPPIEIDATWWDEMNDSQGYQYHFCSMACFLKHLPLINLGKDAIIVQMNISFAQDFFLLLKG